MFFEGRHLSLRAPGGQVWVGIYHLKRVGVYPTSCGRARKERSSETNRQKLREEWGALRLGEVGRE